jgi:hypothetical protein
LLGWTACVAAYLGARRAWLPAIGPDASIGQTVLLALKGIGAGTGLAGLALLVARRVRRMPFPQHPGEVLLVVLGLGALLSSMATALWHAGMIWRWLVPSTPSLLTPLLFRMRSILPLAVESLALLVGAFWVRPLRWKAFFAVAAAAGAIASAAVVGTTFQAIPLGRYVYLWWFRESIVLFANALLVMVILRDRRGGWRYPWTHWLGVSLYLWFGLLHVYYLVMSLVLTAF